jgi:hypothetical protein
MKPKIYNHMIDVAFTVVGPYKDFEDIPYEQLLTGMDRRLVALTDHKEPEAFGHLDVYEELLP